MKEEHEAFLYGVDMYGKDWNLVTAVVQTRSALQIRTHGQKYFNKVEKGHAFPLQPYASMNDPAPSQNMVPQMVSPVATMYHSPCEMAPQMVSPLSVASIYDSPTPEVAPGTQETAPVSTFTSTSSPPAVSACPHCSFQDSIA